MKKSNVLLILLIISFMLQPLQIQAAAKPKVSAHAYIVSDAHSGKILYQQNKDKKIYPASTVKLMTV